LQQSGSIQRLQVKAGQHIEGVSLADHVHFQAVAEARLLAVGADSPVEEANGREVLDAVEAHRLQLAQEDGHQTERIGAVDAGQDRCVAHHGQHLARHVHHDGVGVSVGEDSGHAAAPCHAVAARVVDDNQVHAALLDELGRDSRARSGSQQGAARLYLRAQPPQRFIARNKWHLEFVSYA